MLSADTLCRLAAMPSVGTVCGRLLPCQGVVVAVVIPREVSLERPIAVAARDGGLEASNFICRRQRISVDRRTLMRADECSLMAATFHKSQNPGRTGGLGGEVPNSGGVLTVFSAALSQLDTRRFQLLSLARLYIVEVVSFYLRVVTVHLAVAPASAALCVNCRAKMSAFLSVGRQVKSVTFALFCLNCSTPAARIWALCSAKPSSFSVRAKLPN